jgi:hypothetical protein
MSNCQHDNGFFHGDLAAELNIILHAIVGILAGLHRKNHKIGYLPSIGHGNRILFLDEAE